MEGPFLTLGSLPLEINSCLTYHGGCHIHAVCIPTGPQQVSTQAWTWAVLSSHWWGGGTPLGWHWPALGS